LFDLRDDEDVATVDESEGLSARLFEFLVSCYRGRLIDPPTRPPGVIAVELLMLSCPIEPAPKG
jgi:hypothetical protein